MSILDNIDEFLPQYLSELSLERLKEELKSFPTDGTKGSIYTTSLCACDEIFQGDGLCEIPFYDGRSKDIRPARVMVLSNTCDLSSENKRFEGINLCVAPILRLERYEDRLLQKYSKEQIGSHIAQIKKQAVTHVVYLPQSGKLAYDAIVPLDKVCSVHRGQIASEEIRKKRLFTLSDYGLYLFLLKLSIHFTRIRERIDRHKGEILPPIE